MLKRKECHGDMADIHVYTAKKLEGMADSLENLARTFDGDGQMGRNLSREDGLAALTDAVMNTDLYIPSVKVVQMKMVKKLKAKVFRFHLKNV